MLPSLYKTVLRSYLLVTYNYALKKWQNTLTVAAIVIMAAIGLPKLFAALSSQVTRDIVGLCLVYGVSSSAIAFFKLLDSDRPLLETLFPKPSLRTICLAKALLCTAGGIAIAYGMGLAAFIESRPLHALSAAVLALVSARFRLSWNALSLGDLPWRLSRRISPAYTASTVKLLGYFTQPQTLSTALAYVVIAAITAFYLSAILKADFLVMFSGLVALLINIHVTGTKDALGEVGSTIDSAWVIKNTLGEWLFWLGAHTILLVLAALPWLVFSNTSADLAMVALSLAVSGLSYLLATYFKYIFHGQLIRQSVTLAASFVVPPLGLCYLTRIIIEFKNARRYRN